MSSLVSEAISKSKKSNAAAKSAKPRASATGSSNLIAAAMNKAKKAKEERTPEERRAVKISSSAKGKERVVRGARAVDRRKDTPFLQARNPGTDSEDEEDVLSDEEVEQLPKTPAHTNETVAPARNLLTEYEKPDSATRRRARTQSGDAGVATPVNKPLAVEAKPIASSFSFKAIVFRLACALACAIAFYVVHKQLSTQLQLPSSVQDATLALPGNKVNLFLDSKSSSEREREELKSFRDNLKISLTSKFAEDLTTEKLWEMYQEMKDANGRMFVAMGTLFGFVVAGVFL